MLARAKTISDQEKFMFFPHLYKWVLLCWIKFYQLFAKELSRDLIHIMDKLILTSSLTQSSNLTLKNTKWTNSKWWN